MGARLRMETRRSLLPPRRRRRLVERLQSPLRPSPPPAVGGASGCRLGVRALTSWNLLFVQYFGAYLIRCAGVRLSLHLPQVALRPLY